MSSNSPNTSQSSPHTPNPHTNKKSILIVGNGGREYALGEHLRRDKRVGEIYFATGNAGTKMLGQNIELKSNEVKLRFQ